MARAILRDFEADEAELLARLKRWFLPQYIQLVAKLLPKNGTEGLADAPALDEMDAAARVEALREALAAAEAEAAHGAARGAADAG